ncbi:MAG: SAM-dependent methyltransferase [Candidatus Sericytochromatia bacterium]|nr:SAM-dependent methyltransferase [Candidatus Sericytochromatia bacterium]
MHADKPSRTALIVSLAVLFRHLEPAFRTLTVDVTVNLAERALLEFIPLGGRWRAWLAAKPVRQLVEAVERLVLPGFMTHVVCRKAWIRERVLERLPDCPHLVVVAAGLDGLAASLAQSRAELRTVEVDHPATQALKRRLLGAETASRIAWQGVDLTTERLEQALADDAGARSVFVVEGLTMYLQESEVRRLFEGLAALAAPGSVCVFTFMEPDARGQIRFQRAGAWLDRWLRLVKEPFRWGLARTALRDFLAPTGWQLAEVAESAAMLPASRADAAIARGEWLAVAVRRSQDESPCEGATRP